MTYAQLTIIAEAAHKSMYDLLYAGYAGEGPEPDVDLEVGFEHEQADAAAKLAYSAVIEAGKPFVRILQPVEVD